MLAAYSEFCPKVKGGARRYLQFKQANKPDGFAEILKARELTRNNLNISIFRNISSDFK